VINDWFFRTQSFSSGSEEEDSYEPVVDATFEMTLCLDGGLRLRQPARFNKILQTFERGLVFSETEQMEKMYENLGAIIAVRKEMQREIDRELLMEQVQDCHYEIGNK
jgi:hypothetical protein